MKDSLLVKVAGYFYLLVSHQTLSFSVSRVHTGLYLVCLCVGDRHTDTG